VLVNATPAHKRALDVMKASLDVLTTTSPHPTSVTLAYQSMALATKVLLNSLDGPPPATPTYFDTEEAPSKPHAKRNQYPRGYNRAKTMRYNKLHPSERHQATINAETLAWFSDQPGDHFTTSSGVRTVDVFYAIVMHCTNSDDHGARAEHVEKITGMLRQNAPKHLASLRDQGLITGRKRKQQVYWQPTKYAMSLMDEVSLQEAER
jgi:hypothetical protein